MNQKPQDAGSVPEEASGAEERSVAGRATRRTMLGGVVAGAGALITAGGASAKAGTKTSAEKKTSSSAASAKASGASVQRGHVTTLSVNGKQQKVRAVQGTMLLYVLRNQLGLRGPKFGCGLSECGACAVLADGKQIRSCVTPLSTVGSQKILTLEGLADSYSGPGKTQDGLHPLQQAWIDEQVPQCGYCQNGMIIQAADLLAKNKKPTIAEIKQNMNGHLCRCGTYNAIIRAIDAAAAVMSS